MDSQQGWHYQPASKLFTWYDVPTVHISNSQVDRLVPEHPFHGKVAFLIILSVLTPAEWDGQILVWQL